MPALAYLSGATNPADHRACGGARDLRGPGSAPANGSNRDGVRDVPHPRERGGEDGHVPVAAFAAATARGVDFGGRPGMHSPDRRAPYVF
ncbi:hypothetical protein GCM10010104_35440 [Streptomyces indiaensis]|uniref:Uncharacterized protein n=1 Tax=Streptomyces indiaensis TaxID=284033 RepID=A0ABN3DNF8_9ACTN